MRCSSKRQAVLHLTPLLPTTTTATYTPSSMNMPTLYLTGFDDTTRRGEIVEVLTMSCPRRAFLPSPLRAVSSQTSLLTSTEHSLRVDITFRDSFAPVRFLDVPSAPPGLAAEVFDTVLVLNESKVVSRRCVSSANSWSPYGLRVVLEPSPCCSTRF